MVGDSYPPFAPYGGTGRVPRGGRRTRRRTMRGGNPGYVPQGGEMGTKPQWGSAPEQRSYNSGVNPRGTTGGRRRRRKTRGRRTMRGGYRLSEAAGANHGYTLLGYMPPSNSGQR
jgi:hypothetical protein